jgi:hypothetical protein
LLGARAHAQHLPAAVDERILLLRGWVLRLRGILRRRRWSLVSILLLLLF